MKNRTTAKLLFPLLLLTLLLLAEVPAQAGPPVQGSTDCKTLNQDGVTLYFQARYPEALQKFQAALVCYQETGNRAGEGTALSNIGAVYKAQGRYTEALEVFQRALAILREVGDRAAEGTTLNNIGSVYDAQGRHADALEAYQQALIIHREVGNRVQEGDTLNNIGMVYDAQGRYAEALESYQQALGIAREVGDRIGEGTTLSNIGVVYDNQGRHAEALEMYQQALAIHREVGNRSMEGVTLNNIGSVYRAQGRYAKSLEAFQQALTIIVEVGDRAGEGGVINNIATVYDGQGRYAEALATYQQALVIHREVGNRLVEGTTLNNIGNVHWAQGRYAEALATYQQALVIHREVGNRPMEGTTLNNMGNVYHAQGRYDEALETYQQALAIHREVGNRSMEGTTLTNMGAVYNSQGRYTEALEMHQQALAIRREVGDRAGEGATLHSIGSAYEAQGRYAEALEAYEQALAITREVGDRAGEGTTLNNIGAVYGKQERYTEALESFQQALAIHREVGNRSMEGTTLSNIGAVYESLGRYDEALDHYQQALEVLEAIRAVAGDEQSRAAFIAQHAHLYARATGLFHQLGRDEEAFFTSERGRARAFLDSLATGHVELTDDEAAALLAREQEAYATRQAAQDALARARALHSPDPDLVADLEAQLAEAEAAYAEALAAIEARGDQLAALVPGRSTVLGLSDVQALLDEHTTLLSYFVLDDQTLVFLITRTSFEVIVIEVSRQELAEQVGYFRDVIPFRQPEAIRPVAQELYRLLIAPLSNSLRTPRLAIVPHGPLHYLPFAALVDPDTGQYLLEHYTLITLPSASALPFIQQNVKDLSSTPPHLHIPALILGNPVVEDLPPLIFAEREAQAIAALYQVQPLLGEAATESAVREQASQAGILHLSAHGRYNPHNPLYSTIALAPDQANDGWLEVHEVYGLGLTNADLVVLSACQTQLGELSAGDELVGLTRAFFFAGTPTVIATLWNVDDEATGLLMERFYTHLGEGMGKAAALRQAQLEVREAYPDPYYWAGFVLSGDGGEVSESEIPAPTPTVVPTVDRAPQETPVPSPEPEAPSSSNRVWLVVGGGLLVVVVVTGLLIAVVVGGVVWWRRTTRHQS